MTNFEDSIFDIFEDVLSTDFAIHSSVPDPLPTLPSTAMVDEEETTTVKEEVEPQEDICTNPLGWSLKNIRNDVKPTDGLCFIKVRSRGDEDVWNTVPEVMYSSLRYTMNISVDPSCFPDTHTHLIMCQIRVVDENGNEIKKENNEPVIKGPKEFQNLEINRDTGRLECEATIKWQSVSFHHAKRKFAFQVSFNDFANGTMQFLFEARSGSFLTYARRPKVSERVKKTPVEQPVQTAICKKRKINKKEDEKSIYFQKFAVLLEQLITMKESLPEQEKQLASQVIRERLLSMQEDLSIEDQQ